MPGPKITLTADQQARLDRIRARPESPIRQEIRTLQARARSEPSPRELEVLQLLADGLTDARVGEVLFLSEHTIKSHVKGLLRTLETRNRAQTVAEGFRRGLIV